MRLQQGQYRGAAAAAASYPIGEASGATGQGESRAAVFPEIEADRLVFVGQVLGPGLVIGVFGQSVTQRARSRVAVANAPGNADSMD